VPRGRPPKNPPPADTVDVNQVVAYNVRAARELRGWTQDDLADRLAAYTGMRPTQANVSAIERAWDGDRRREFDAHELLIFSLVFELPIMWFLLPPPGDHRLMSNTSRPVDELYMHLVGRPDQLEPVLDRLRQLGVTEPTNAEETVERITGQPSSSRDWSYTERRKQLVLALLDDKADRLDKAADELGAFFDHLRQVGIRGYLAEHTNDDDFVKAPAAKQTPKRVRAAKKTRRNRA
jgi:transcriptional regulator with XRE-family HTH domain